MNRRAFLKACTAATAAAVARPSRGGDAETTPLVRIGEHRLVHRRQAAAVVALKEHLYVFGGFFAGAGIGHVERVNLHTGAVEVVTDRALSRRHHAAIEHEGLIYLFGGEGQRHRAAYEPVVEIFDPAAATFSRGVPMPRPGRGSAFAKVGGRAYFFGGSKWRNGRLAYSTDTDVYDFQTQAWSSVSALSVACESRAVTVDSLALLFGGYNGRQATDVVLAYASERDAWRTLAPLPRPTSAHSAVRLGHLVFLFGDYEDLDSVLAFDLTTQKAVRFRGGFSGLRHTAAVAHRDRIYVVGGNRTTETGDESDLVQVFALSPDYRPT